MSSLRSKDRIYRHELVTCGRMGCWILRKDPWFGGNHGVTPRQNSSGFGGWSDFTLRKELCPINRNLRELIYIFVFRMLWIVFLQMLSLREVMERQPGFSLSAGMPQVEVTLLLIWCNMETLGTPMPWNPSVKAPWQSSNVQLFIRVALVVFPWLGRGYIWQTQMKTAIANEKDVLYMTSSSFIIKLFASWFSTF